MRARLGWIGSLAFACAAACSNSDSSGGDHDPGPVTLPAIGDGEMPGSGNGTGTSKGEARDSAAGLPIVGTSAMPSASGASSTPAPMTSAPPVASGASSAAAPLPPTTPIMTPPPATPATGVAPPSSTTPVSPTPTTMQPPVAAGVLTAGTWDDNRNYARFKQYRSMLLQASTPGVLPSSDEEHESAHNEFSQIHGPRQTLDVALMIDTTGSMGDEISYLQREFLALSTAIEERYPNAAQRWSLVVYRDISDEYVVRWFDFRDDASDFRDKLALQFATGGGDFPEAPDAALAQLVQLAWRTDKDTARLAFWVADAPHHNDKAEAMLAAIRAARSIDVHLYPVASSGVNELTELSMRTSAQLTGGRYLFLTDDSRVGGAHKEPSIPCYFVTRLDKAILRMVEIELSGKYAEPEQMDVIRTGGDPKDGACKLESGDTVQIF